jgi:hypothetical protein
MMKQDRHLHRRATLLLLAAVAFPSTPLLAQDQPTASEVTVPPVTLPDPIVTPSSPVSQPPVTQTTPPLSTATQPPAATAPTPVTEAPAAPERRAATRIARSTPRAAPQPRATTPARQAAPAVAAPAAAGPATPTEAAPAPVPAPAVTPAPLPVPEEPAGAESGPSILAFAIGGGLLLLLGFALFSMLRHRRRREAPEEDYHEEPVAAEPVHDVYDAPRPMTAAMGAGALAADDRDERRLSEPAAVGWDSPIDGPTVAPAAYDEASAAEDAVAVAEPAAVGWDSPIDGPTVAPVAHEEAPLADEPPIYTQPATAAAAAAPAAAGAAAVIASDQPSQRREVLSSPIGDVVEPEAVAPAANGEAIAVPEEALVAKADAADAEALAASSTAPDGRPWLEFLMRPVRAGTSKDATVVEFELTVGNTGTAAARDVRISTFMFAAGSAQASEMERMLINPPADAAVTEVDIEAGDATRVEASMALPREGLSEESVLPVVVADARYRLPDGSEGRTLAQFEVGIPIEGGLDPFPTERTSGLLEGVEARLRGEPERL